MQDTLNYSALIISGVAAFISIRSLILSERSNVISKNSNDLSERSNAISYQALNSSVEPVLVFAKVKVANKDIWAIENVGKGPALDLKVYRGSGGEDSWDGGIRVHALPAGTLIKCPFEKGCSNLGASYKSMEETKYASTCFAHIPAYYKGDGPEKWKDIPLDTLLEQPSRFTNIQLLTDDVDKGLA